MVLNVILKISCGITKEKKRNFQYDFSQGKQQSFIILHFLFFVLPSLVWITINHLSWLFKEVKQTKMQVEKEVWELVHCWYSNNLTLILQCINKRILFSKCNMLRQWIIISKLNMVEILFEKMPKWQVWKNQVGHFLKQKQHILKIQFRSVQLLSPVQLFVTPWTAARQASLSITNTRSLPKLMSIESVMPSNHLILCHSLLLPSKDYLAFKYYVKNPGSQGRWISSRIFHILHWVDSPNSVCLSSTEIEPESVFMAHRCGHCIMFATTWYGYQWLWKNEHKFSWMN